MAHHHHLRDHFRALISSRRALFHARIIIHELIHIPLVQGDFLVRWRFTNAQSISSGDPRTKPKKPDEESSGGTIDDAASSEHESVRAGGSSSSNSLKSSISSQHHLRPQMLEKYSSQSSYGRYLSPEPAETPTVEEDEIEVPDTFLSSAKGRTEWSPLLHDHSVAYNQRVDVELEMFIDKDTRELQPCELKLEVQQNLPSMDPKDQKQVLGVVYINLAEYAKAGPITRRHLLQKSKVNAVMRVSVELVQHAGETDFIAPPLPVGQLMSGVAGLLDRDRLLNAPVKLENFQGSKHGTPTAGRSPRPGLSPRPSNIGKSSSLALSSLPSASTEAIIDALFNPYESPSSVPSPFTIPASMHPDAASIPNVPELIPSDRLSVGGESQHSEPPHARRQMTLDRFAFRRRDTTAESRHKEKKGRWWKPGPPPLTHASTFVGSSSNRLQVPDRDSLKRTASRPESRASSASSKSHQKSPAIPQVTPIIAITDVDRN